MKNDTPTPIKILAPAKINLFLRVLDKQRDGYHRIFSLMQMVGLYDEIEIRKVPTRKGVSLSVVGLKVPRGDKNIAVRAAKEFLSRFDWEGGVEIRLDKRIPVSAGLGGGSSDAAAILTALSRLGPLKPTPKDLVEMARRIGSDVPFFLTGPTALVRGTGESVQPVHLIGEGWVVLINPNTPVSTAEVYRQWDDFQGKRGGPWWPSQRKIGLTLGEKQIKISARSTFRLANLPPYLHNDLEWVVLKAHPVIGVIEERLRRLGAKGVLMSGSGPTVFGLFFNPAAARKAARGMARAGKGWSIWVIRVLKRSPLS